MTTSEPLSTHIQPAASVTVKDTWLSEHVTLRHHIRIDVNGRRDASRSLIYTDVPAQHHLTSPTHDGDGCYVFELDGSMLSSMRYERDWHRNRLNAVEQILAVLEKTERAEIAA